jgi:hypothetical protein
MSGADDLLLPAEHLTRSFGSLMAVNCVSVLYAGDLAFHSDSMERFRGSPIG